MVADPPPSAPLRLVLLDCDGTIVDGQAAAVGAMAAALGHLGLPAPAEMALRAVIGLPPAEQMARLLPADIDPAAAAAALAHYRSTFQSMSRDPALAEPLYPGMRKALERIAAAGVLLGIVTGKGRRSLLATLAHHDLERHFVTLHTADDGPGKPAPDMVQRAICRTGADAGSTMVVGDTIFDIQMALNARVHAVGVAWGYHPALALKRAGAERIATMPAELPRIIHELLPGDRDAPRL